MATILVIVILIFSVIIHEVSHGLAAYLLGDPTAKYAGRLTLNPISHLDPIGSIFLPILLAITGAPIFGWAKPVPYNPHNLNNQKYGSAIVGAAGPLSNVFLAIISAILLRLILVLGIGEDTMLASFLAMMLYVNVLLMVFNLIPIPPLDGSKLLFTFLPISEYTKANLEQYGFVFLLALIFIFGGLLQFLLFFGLSIFSRIFVGVGPEFIVELIRF